MRKKSIFLFLSMFILGVISTLSFFDLSRTQLQPQPAYAESTNASVWDGNEAGEVGESDFYSCTQEHEDLGVGAGETHHHIMTAKGFASFQYLINHGLRPFMGEKVFLETDIDLAGQPWTPIGIDDSHSFKGYFDGQGHSIFNLKVNNEKIGGSSFAGLFGVTSGTVQNLSLIDVDINVSGVESVGAVAGNLTGSTTHNLFASGKIVTSGASFVGGIYGQSSVSARRSVTNVMSRVDIVADNYMQNAAIGGVFGKYSVGNGTIEEIAFEGSISRNDGKVTITTTGYVGGLLGELGSFSEFKNSYNAGRIEAVVTPSAPNLKQVGTYNAGLVGFVNSTSSSGTMSNLYNVGEIPWGNSDAENLYSAGLFGLFAKSGTRTISNCFNAYSGESEIPNGTINYPLFGNINNATVNVSNSWYDVHTYSGKQYSLRGLADMARSKGFYSSDIYFSSADAWDFNTVWGISSGINDGHPYLLKTQSLNNPNNNQAESKGLEGEGTFENPYLIKTAADMGFLSSHYASDRISGGDAKSLWANKYFSLQNDIDLTGRTWQPIGGTSTLPFEGVFDGNGFAISGMTCSLQFKYGSHGLFGYTKNAVIKNLEIKDVRFINDDNVGGSTGVMGSIVGTVLGETYIANCVDNSGVENLLAVGQSAKSALTIAYGKANLVNVTEVKKLNTDAEKNASFREAYDVEFLGEGGIFYGRGKVVDGVVTSRDILSGGFHVMIDAQGNLMYCGNEKVQTNLQNIDAGWGKTIPSVSDNFYTEVVDAILIKKGYKLSKYKMSAGAETEIAIGTEIFSPSTYDLEKMILGVKAIYEEQPQKSVQVVYNQYEVKNFNATGTSSYVRSKLFKVDYDSILSLDYPTIFNTNVTKDGRTPLRGTDFTIEGFYFKEGENLFAHEVDQMAFANDANLADSEIYTKWVGNEDSKYVFTVTFSKIDDPILGKFDLTKAIKSVNFEGYDGAISNLNASAFSTFEEVGGKVRVSYTFDTTFSDRADNGINVKINLAAGYDFSQEITLHDFGAQHDFSFGHLAFGSKGSNNVIGDGTSTTLSESSFSAGENFRNLDEDYSIDIVLQRGMFSTPAKVSSNVYFAIAPEIKNVTSVSIYPDAYAGDPTATTPTTQLIEQNYIGFDAVNASFVSGQRSVGTESDTNGHAFSTNLKDFTDLLVAYKFAGEGGEQTRYFRVVKESLISGYNSFTYYEEQYVNGRWEKVEMLARYDASTTGQDNILRYLINAEFAILGSVQDSSTGTKIEHFENFGDSFSTNGYNAKTDILVQDDVGTKKLIHNIKVENIIETTDNQIGYTDEPLDRLLFVTRFTTVSFSVKTVFRDGNKLVDIGAQQAPKVALKDGATGEERYTYDIPNQNIEHGAMASQTIIFDFEASDYYTMSSSPSVSLSRGSDAGANVLVSVKSLNEDEEQIADENEKDSGNNDGWRKMFAAQNALYFSGSSITKNADTGKKEGPLNAKYTFSINFGYNASEHQTRQELLAGEYIIQVVCEKISYDFNIATGYVEYNNGDTSSYTRENIKNSIEGAGSPTVSAQVGADTTSTKLGVDFDADVSVSTTMGSVKAYVFYDWYVEGELWSGFLSNLGGENAKQTAFDFEFSELYMVNPPSATPTSGDRQYRLNLTAVYIRKEISITLDPQTRVAITGESVYVGASTIGVSITYTGLNYIYYNSTRTSQDVNWTVKFDKGGVNGDSYYLSGFIIFNSSSIEVKRVDLDNEPDSFTDKGVFTNEYSINEFVLAKLEEDETLGVSTKYTIIPILTRKTANVFIVSGSGDGYMGMGTDGKNGDIFYMDGERKVSTTNTVVEIGSAKVNDTFYLNLEMSVTVDGEVKSVVVDSLYEQRTGYSTPLNGYWRWTNGSASSGDNSLNGSQLYISNSYFNGTSEDVTTVTLVVYRAWEANSYYVHFMRNGGVFEGSNSPNESISITVYYDQQVENVPNTDDITNIGYALGGWTRSIGDADQRVFNENGEALRTEGIIDGNLNYILTNDLTVYALWTPRQYTVRIDTNGANTLGGRPAERYVDVEMTYGETFERVFEEYGLGEGVENAPTREGFIFNELYATGSFRQTISATTVFDESIPGCSVRGSDPISLTLFMDWTFDTSYVDLSFTNNMLTKEYSAAELSFFIAEYFQNGYDAKGYVIRYSGEHIVSITLNDNVHASVQVAIMSEDLYVDGGISFTVKNVGRYNLSLVLTIEDEISAGTQLYSQTLNLYAEVTPATLDGLIASESEDVWLINAKRLMANYVPMATKTRMDSCRTFGTFVTNVMRPLDPTIDAGATNEQVYEYVAYKYYYMITASDFVRYKQMTYADFASQRESLQQDIENVLTRIYFFEFNDHEAFMPQEVSAYTSTIVLRSQTVTNPTSEIRIDRVEIIAEEVEAGNTYDFRAVLKSIGSGDNLGNYTLSYDENGEAYITLGNIYIMPEIFALEDRAQSHSTYYNENVELVDVLWGGDRDVLVVEGVGELYQIKENLYARASLHTSNNGDEKTDTRFTFVDQENYLYFENVAIYQKIDLEGGEYQLVDVTNQYTFVLEESFVYTILNVDGVATVSVSAKFLTYSDGFMELMDLPADLPADLLTFTQVTYDIGLGERKFTNTATGLEERAYEDAGYIIFQVERNNNNTISIILSKFVKKLTVVTLDKSLSEYVALYKWVDAPTYVIDGTMETNTSYTLNKEELASVAGQVTNVELYAVYTDMVYVQYNLNFPDIFQTSSPTSSWLKLGSSTKDDLLMPREEGFKLSSLTVTKTKQSYESLFDANDGLFKGLVASDRHTKVELEAKWEIEEMQYEQLLETYTTSVYGFSYLTAASVVMIYNKNEGLFTYTYEWSKDGVIVSQFETLTLAGNGALDESGTYQLVVTATVRSEFLSTAIENPDMATNSITLTFDLQFVKNLLRGITFAGETTFDYDGTDHMRQWYVTIEYAIYNPDTEEYSQDSSYVLEYYIGAINLDFDITRNGLPAGEMKDAGTYHISATGKFEVFSNATEFGAVTFDIVVNPMNVELADYEIQFSKNFNEYDGDLARDINLANENVRFNFARALGEEIGTYDVRLLGVSEESKDNFRIKMNGTTLFENGVLTTAGRTTKVGTFEIQRSGTLTLFYEVTSANPETIEVGYASGGYRVELSGYTLKIYRGETEFKSLTLHLYDENLKEEVTREDILRIVTEKFANVRIHFFDTTDRDTITNSGTYTYSFTGTDEITTCFSNVAFRQGYQFVVGKIEIDITQLGLDKVYDGKTIDYYTTAMQKIDDLESYTGVYISATYQSVHVGDTRVDLSLHDTNDSEEVSNYVLSAGSAQAKISKLVATLTATMTENSYEYGQISLSNVDAFVDKNYVIRDEMGRDVSDLLAVGYYSITYSFDTSVGANANGFVYKGEYKLVVNATFVDFTMSINAPNVVITTKTIEKGIAVGQFSILASQQIQANYGESYTLNETGDEITILYAVVGVSVGQPAPVNLYDLRLYQDTYVNGSVKFTIAEHNQGFEVKTEDNLVYIVLNSEELQGFEYNGLAYTFTVDLIGKRLEISNNNTSRYVTIKFEYAKDGNTADDVVLSELDIFSGVNTTSFVDAGSYRLAFKATSSTHSNFAFKEEYNFVISKKRIDASLLDLTRTYSGLQTFTVDTFAGKIGEDGVSLVVKFDSADVGKDIPVTIFLQGAKSNNYELYNTENLKGEIVQAEAYIQLDRVTYTYGVLTQRDSVSFSVLSGGLAVPVSQYDIILNIEGAVYSSVGYLECNTYNISLDESSSSRNYHLNFTGDQKVTVEALSIAVVLTTSGQYTFIYGASETTTDTFDGDYTTPLNETITLTFTRTSGREVGYYKVLSAVSKSKNYTISATTDRSTGAFRITKAQEIIYILMSSADKVAGTEREVAHITYDGNLYDKVTVVAKMGGGYQLLFESTAVSSAKQYYDLNYYSYDSDADEYTRLTDVAIDGLRANISFANGEGGRNVGEYLLNVQNATADNFAVVLGKYGQQSFYLEIGKRDLYFREETVTKVFDNEDAIMTYDDASELLSGILERDLSVLTLSIRLTKDGRLGKYVGYDYTVEATLDGGEANYNLHLATEGDGGSAVIGQILPADLKITVNDQSFVYGDEVKISFTYTAEIDLNRYEKQLSVSVVPIAQITDYSTSGCLRVGRYGMNCFLGTEDFKAVYVVNGQESESLDGAYLVIIQKSLSVEGVSEELEEIFRKKYDGDNTIKITDEDGNNRLSLVGVVGKVNPDADPAEMVYDNVTLESASYETEVIGTTISVIFTLGGNSLDCQNYKLDPYGYGVIEPVLIGLEFNYNAEGNIKSNVETNNLPQINSLAYPFMSDSNLSTNSGSANTTSARCFPINLTGWTGHTFKKWTISFEVAQDSEGYNFLVSVLRAYELENTFADGVFTIDVANDSQTVGFLRSLLEDSQNRLNTYYKNERGVTFTFDAVWEINTYQVNIKVADENNADAQYGKVTLRVGDGDEIEITSSYSGTYTYGTKLTLLATAFEHCSYYGFYNANGSIHYDNTPTSGITVSPSGDGVLLTVESLGAQYNFVARFEVEKVNLTVDLSGATDATIDSEHFVKGEDNFIYTWRATFIELQAFSLADIGLHRDGYNLLSFSDGQSSYASTAFADTFLAGLVPEGELALALTPIFEAMGVKVTLIFDDGKTEDKDVIVPFRATYGEGIGWIENPEREGYSFEGWFNAEMQRITGASVLETFEEHSLTAHWQILSFDVTLTTENVTISQSAGFVVDGNTYSLTEIEYGTEIVFSVTANAGYELTDDVVNAWSEFFAVTLGDDKVAQVTLTIPAQDVDCVISALAKLNTVSIFGEHLERIDAFDITNYDLENEKGDQSPVDVQEQKVKIESGKKLKLVVYAEYGYQMIRNFVCDDESVVIVATVENDVLTLIISNILQDISIELSTLEVINDITIRFDDAGLVEDLMSNGYSYKDHIADSDPFRVMEGDTLVLYIKYIHGYEYSTYQTAGRYVIEVTPATEGVYAEEGYFKVTISTIEEDGTITFATKRCRYTLSTQVFSYDETRQLVEEPQNQVKIAGIEESSIEVEFGDEVTLTYQMSSIYNFAGWSKDGENVFSSQPTLVYAVDDNVTIYAIFSSLRFNVTFATFNNYTLYSEYGDPDRERIIYQEIIGQGERYIDADSGEELTSFEIYYGASKTISYVVPTGYRFYGFGYMNGEDFEMLEVGETDAPIADFTISSLDFNEEMTEFVLYVIVKAYSFTINVNTAIDIEGIREENIDVGGAKLQGEHGEEVNAYGYVDGTRVRYSADNFVDGRLLDDRAFKVLGYTGEIVYIKATVTKVGYKFLDIVSTSTDVTITQIEKTDTYGVYSIRGAIGGTQLDLDVLFRPNLNDIRIGFKLGENDVDGGAITYLTDDKNSYKVHASGRDYSSITVSAYTDSTFEVVVYIRAGFAIDLENIDIQCENDIIDRDSIVGSLLSITTDGFIAQIRFAVRDYLSTNEIFIMLDTTTYTVKLIEEGQTLAIVRNVEFGALLNLFQTNEDNIEIVDTEGRVDFVEGKLAFLMEKDNYHFEGFFTSENGAGVMYIDANGNVVYAWYENGYQLNSLTSKYELTENAYINPLTGEMEISLYSYWSYYKTRITFTFVPDINVSATAQDIVSGVDYTNSWFYSASRNYIEVAFNTNIYITAPNLNGYKFYKFVIKQKDINGVWLEDVVSYANEVPWSTNEIDCIIECRIEIVYFAQIDVIVFGGEGGFRVEQESSDAQATALNEQNFVDTTKPFTLVAVFDENNFEFVRWSNITTGQTGWQQNWEGLEAKIKLTLILNLQGKTFEMTFLNEDNTLYDTTFGQVTNVVVTSADGVSTNYRLGHYSAGIFLSDIDTITVKVGDSVSIAVAVDYGFAVVWNVEDIALTSYRNGLYYFTMRLANCPESGVLRVLPTFENEIISIYINRNFIRSDIVPDATDFNVVNVAGYATFGGRRTDTLSVATDIQNVTITLVTNPRYRINSIVVRNYDNVIEDMAMFTDAKGNILFTRQFLDSNNIIGSVQIDVLYERVLWEYDDVSETRFGGKGTDDDPYVISSVEQLVLMMKLVNSGAVTAGGVQYRSASYILRANIDLSDKFWTPIGTIEYSFNGYFNFNGHRVTGISTAYVYNEISYGGLFGVISPNAEIVANKTSIWYVYVIVAIVVVLIIIVIILVLVARKRKKRREQLATK